MQNPIKQFEPPNTHRGAVTPWLVLGALLIAGVYYFLPAGVIWTARTLAQDPEPNPLSLVLPEGFKIETYAEDLASPRFMEIDEKHRLYVAESGGGRVLVLIDEDNDGKVDKQVTLIAGLEQPTSLAFTPDKRGLYVAESHQITLLELGPNLEILGRTLVVDDLPAGGRHRSKTVLVGADNKLYVSIGSSCDVCEEEDDRRAAVMQYGLDGSNGFRFAKGVRNAVGMAVDPSSGSIYVSNHGRDLLGDDLPPETVYRLEAGMDAGWPYCHAGNLLDPKFGKTGSCDKVAQPVFQFQAHSAPLGIFFYTGAQFPSRFRDGFFLAYHGSWNRTVPTGYKVVFVPKQGDKYGPEEDFVSGWLDAEQRVNGRPVGFAQGADGSLFVSDDRAGMIYKVSYP